MMKARQRIQWAAGLAMAITVTGMGEVGAQQTPGVSTFPDIRAPQSLGFNPGVISPFSPNFRGPLSGTFSPFVVPFGSVSAGSAPIGMLDANGIPRFGVSPFTPDFRQPLTGTFNPVINVPITSPFVLGDSVTGVNGTAPFFVGPSTFWWGPNGGVAVQPVPVPVAVPVPVTAQQQRALAAQAARRPRLRLTPTPERRSLQAAEQVMARTPLTEGTVVSADSRNVRVRMGTAVRSYPRSQVFFFTSTGEMRSAAVQRAGLTRGLRVLVPMTNRST